jgi:hypothetical protein
MARILSCMRYETEDALLAELEVGKPARCMCAGELTFVTRVAMIDLYRCRSCGEITREVDEASLIGRGTK